MLTPKNPRNVGVIVLIAGIVLALSISQYFYTTGKTQWQHQAQANMQRISELFIFRLQRAYEPMLGLSMLMQGSQDVTQQEFTDALRLTQQDDADIKRTDYAFIVQQNGDILVQLTSINQAANDSQNLLSPSAQLTAHLSTHKPLQTTLELSRQRPGVVSVGPIFKDSDGLHKVFFAIATGSQSASGFMLALVDIETLLHDLHEQQVPRGLRCILRTPDIAPDTFAMNLHATSNPPVSEHRIDTQLAGQPWQLVWQLYDDYLGGHATRLSLVVMITGILIAVLTGFLAYLWRTDRERAKQLDVAYQTLQKTTQQMIKSEKMASLGSLVAGIAHEMNTPVGNSLTVATALRQRAREFAQSVQDGTLRKSILTDFLNSLDEATELLESNTRRAAQLVGNFKQVAVDQSSERRRTFDLRQAIDETLWTLEPSLKMTHHRISVEVAKGIACDSYPGAIGQILTNLVSNSVQHGFEGKPEGHIAISATYLDGDIHLHYKDDGCGIAQEHLNKVFDPFFTTKLGQGGSGLGLHIIYNLVTGLLGGEVAIDSEAGHGVHIILHFPAHAPVKQDTRIAIG